MKLLHTAIVGGLFCIWASPLALDIDLAPLEAAAQEKEKSKKGDAQATEVAEQFVKEWLKGNDVDAIMKNVDVPFFYIFEKIDKREHLKEAISSLVGASRPKADGRSGAVYSFGSLPMDFFRDSDRKIWQELLKKSDRFVFFHVGRFVYAVGVRVEGMTAKVVGVDFIFSGMPLVMAAQEKEEGDKRTANDRESAKGAARLFVKAAKAKNVDSLMKLVDLPWFRYYHEIIKDPDDLRKNLADLVNLSVHPSGDVFMIASYGAIRDLLFQVEKDLQRADQVFAKNDWAVFFRNGHRPGEVERGRTAIAFVVVRVREGQSKIIGLNRE